jgi:hypothetical protein
MNETYTAAELDALVDFLVNSGWRPSEGFQQYAIRGIYVSPDVIERALQERFERMVSL